MSTVSNRNGTLDVLKFCFALMILLHHTRQLIPELKLFQGYYIGVYFFFMVSGIFMAKCAVRDSDLDKNALGFDTLHYMKKRIIALFPCYAVAFLICFIVSEIVGPTSINHMISDANASVFSLIPLEMAGFSSNISIGGSWFISAMLIAQYLLYPLARHNSTSFFCIFAPLTAIVLFGYLSKNYMTLGNPFEGNSVFYTGLLQAIAAISLGACCYSAGEWLHRISLNRLTAIIFQVASYLIVLTISIFTGKTQLDFVLVLILAVGVTFSYAYPSIRLSQSAWSSRFSKLSYPLYLVHMSVLLALKNMSLPLDNIALFLLYFILSIGAAFLCLKAGECMQRLLFKSCKR